MTKRPFPPRNAFHRPKGATTKKKELDKGAGKVKRKPEDLRAPEGNELEGGPEAEVQKTKVKSPATTQEEYFNRTKGDESHKGGGVIRGGRARRQAEGQKKGPKLAI